MRDTVQVRIRKNVGGYKAGQVINVPASADGQPTELFWLRKLEEAKRDQCVEIVTPNTEGPEVPKKATRKRRTNRSTA